MNIEVKNMKIVDGKLSMKLVINEPVLIREFQGLIDHIKTIGGNKAWTKTGTHYHRSLKKLLDMVNGMSISKPSVDKSIIREQFKVITQSRQRAHEAIWRMIDLGILAETAESKDWIVDTEKAKSELNGIL